ncbi:MAG: hypothetical protein E7263_07705, partial [Lachnospiraceae bacterium]|nr:hypothetical protein [Lachnospiraceae bacterium]
MKRTSKVLMKKISSFCVAIAMVLSVSGSPMVVAYAYDLENVVVSEESVVSEDVVGQEPDAKKGTPTDALVQKEPSLNGAPTDIEIATVDITVTVPRAGEINPAPVFTNNGVGYNVEINPRDGYFGWQDAG